jgi:hypothetical protein
MDRNSNYSQTWLHQTAWENLFIKPQFVIIIEFVTVVNIDLGPKKWEISVRYNQKFVMAEFVITELHCK